MKQITSIPWYMWLIFIFMKKITTVDLETSSVMTNQVSSISYYKIGNSMYVVSNEIRAYENPKECASVFGFDPDFNSRGYDMASMGVPPEMLHDAHFQHSAEACREARRSRNYGKPDPRISAVNGCGVLDVDQTPIEVKVTV